MGIMIKGKNSDYIMQHLISWNLVDDVSDKIDQISLSFSAERMNTLPPYGAKYEVFIHGVSRGKWEIIWAGIDGLDVMTIKLSTVAKYGKVKEKATYSYIQKSIYEIVTAIVSPCGYVPDVGTDVGAKIINFYRNNETVGDCLNRLAKDHGCISKPFDRVWMVRTKGTPMNQAGKQKPTVKITHQTRLTRINLIHAANDSYKGVKVTYFDEDKNKHVEVIKGSEPFNNLGMVLKSKAMDAIAAYSNYNQNAEERISLDLPTSDPMTGYAFAQGVLEVDYSRFIKGTFVIDSVTMDENKTKIEASKPNGKN